MKDQGSEPDDKQDGWLLAEALIIGILLLGVYACVALEVFPILYDWVLFLFGKGQ